MKNDFLNTLTLNILANSPKGISKVKLAKIFYLTHKWMIINNLAASGDWCYVRMPLGPVPVDFKTLAGNRYIRVKYEPTSLSYNAEIYTLAEQIPGNEIISKINEIVRKLDKFSTSTLVEFTHGEPSWKNNVNGSEYSILKEDLDRHFLSKPVAIDEVRDNQQLQGQLIEGMIDDIVEESTALEYPK